ncbi:uncharacterized protein VP01_699g3, partial [Puccinia sorghi]
IETEVSLDKLRNTFFMAVLAQDIPNTIVINQKQKCSSDYLEQDIDENVIEKIKKIKALKHLNVRRCKATILEKGVRKQRKVTLGKYQVVEGKMLNSPAFLFYCSQEEGGPTGLVHTHKWCTVV